MQKFRNSLRRIKITSIYFGLISTLLFTFVFAFQNCSQGFQTNASSSNSQNASPVLSSTNANLPYPKMLMKQIIASPFGGTCVIGLDDLLKCWPQPVIGVGTALPSVIDGLGPVSSAALGGGFGCAITIDQKFKCWGIADSGQVGLGIQTATGVYPPIMEPPTEIPILQGAKQVSAGFQNACAISANNQLYCWGLLSGGISLSPKLISLPTITDIIVKVEVRQQATDGYVLTANGSLYTIQSASAPILTGVRDIASGASFSCANMLDITVRCWGTNNFGQLGTNSTFANFDPTTSSRVLGLTNVKSISLGQAHACALLNDGTMKCWGNNGFSATQIASGMLGNGANVPYSMLPVVTSNIFNIRNIAASDTTTCAVLNDNTGYCWGLANPALGTNDTFYSAKPVDTQRFDNFKSYQYGCGLTLGAQIDCEIKVGIPAGVFALTGVKQLSPGYQQYCALLSTGQIKCWGSGLTGLVDISGITSASQIAKGYGHTCAIEAADGSVKCWLSGAAFPVAASNTPTLIAGVSAATKIISGEGHSCALLASGQVKCWGDNGYGQLGNGNKLSAGTAIAVDVLNLTNVKAISTNYTANTSCAINGDNKVKCWGTNLYGILGRGNNLDPVDPSPQEVSGLSDAQQISVSGDHVCSLTSAGAKCWGSNMFGQLGTGDRTLWYAVPTPAMLTDKTISSIVSHSTFTLYEFADGTKAFAGYAPSGNVLAPTAALR